MVKENILRSLFGVWQEYRGLGLYDGQSHAAELFHTIYVALLSIVMPQEFIRWIVLFFLWIIGGAGMYYLLKRKIVGALFYVFNIATIQMFYTPFEAFAFHFAALPWLAFTLINVLTKPTRRNFVAFFAVALLTTPQFFIPTLMIPTVLLLTVIILTSGKHALRPAVWAAIGFLCVNAFWLIPFVYGIPKTAPVIMNAKINQMSSGEDLARNRAFSTPADILLLRGFALDFEDYDTSGAPIFLMAPWRNFLNYPLIIGIQVMLAAITIIGLFATLKKSNKRYVPFAVLFLLCALLLGSDLLQRYIPILGEALRFPFTKFSLLFTFAYSALLVLGIETITTLPAIELFIGLSIFAQAIPIFTGNLVSPNLQVSFPDDYKLLYQYMQDTDKNQRVMVLPQSSYWSWKLYYFHYRGSGFMWFGLPQPIMDRAFDPWSATNENYYWELSRALYAKDAAGVAAVIGKYDIRYILLDENVTTPNNNRSLFIDDIKNMLGPSAKTFGKLSLYERAPRTDTFISLKQNLPTVNPYTWTDNDVAYRELGDYITGEGGVTYQFRSLFTKRSVSEREFDALALLAGAVPVYDSTASADLSAAAVKECGLLKEGAASASETDGALQLRSVNQRGCLSFDIPTLSHTFGYLAAVESRHATGRPLMISFINDTARHVEEETYLPIGRQVSTDYFILPPLAPDGLGYTVYLSNDSIGNQETINTVSRIRFYQIPYNDLVKIRTGTQIPASAGMTIQVSHPNPAFYKVVTQETGTLILSQSYDPGWIALSDGKILPHVRVNNWKNGWTLDPGTSGTIYIFFWPQLLEFLGFALLPIPFFLCRRQAI